MKEKRPIPAVEVVYNDIYQIALTYAENNLESLTFDPQGRCLIRLFKTDHDELAKNMLVSVDIRDSDKLSEKYDRTFGLDKNKALSVFKKIGASLIPVQHEIEIFLYGTLRTLNQFLTQHAGMVPLSEPDIYELFQKIAKEMNCTIVKKTNELLRKYCIIKSGRTSFDLKKINLSLDASRESFASECTSLLCKALTPRHALSSAFLEEHKDTLKHVAETTPALEDDMLWMDAQQGCATFIEGSNLTAHYREASKRTLPVNFAHRQIIQLPASKGKIQKPERASRLWIRVPSPVQKRKAVKSISKKLRKNYSLSSAFVKDSKLKIKELYETYLTAAPPANLVIYNRLTAILDTVSESVEDKNQQTEGTLTLLLAMHTFNKEKEPSYPYFWIENISVNGFGASLQYDKEPLLTELTLLTEIAILDTCRPVLDEEEQQRFDQIMQCYTQFLVEFDDETPFFSEHGMGIEARKQIKQIQASYYSSTRKKPAFSDTLIDNCRKALLVCLFDQAHMTHQFAKLVQTLSAYCQPIAVVGCKSGNERAQAINGRISLLDSLDFKKQYSEEKVTVGEYNFERALEAVIYGKKGAIANLNESLHKMYNHQNLNGAMTYISLSDQYAPAKVQASSGKLFSRSMFNRNYAEENNTWLSNLSTKRASALQAHKGWFNCLLEGVKKYESDQNDAEKTITPKRGWFGF